MKDYARQSGEKAVYFRALNTEPGADGPESRIAEYFEHQRDVALARSRGRDLPQPLRAEWFAEMRADVLTLEAVAPWPGLTLSEKEERLRKATEACPWSAHAHAMLATFLGLSQRSDEALEEQRRAFELNPASIKRRTTLAQHLADRGDFAEALQLSDIEDPSPALVVVRAYCTLELGDAESATKTVEKVLGEHPRNTTALRVHARCLRALGEKRRAADVERRASFYERGVASPGEQSA